MNCFGIGTLLSSVSASYSSWAVSFVGRMVFSGVDVGRESFNYGPFFLLPVLLNSERNVAVHVKFVSDCPEILKGIVLSKRILVFDQIFASDKDRWNGVRFVALYEGMHLFFEGGDHHSFDVASVMLEFEVFDGLADG